jgi:RNA polymerase sigma-70 factor (ECF subfamily)
MFSLNDPPPRASNPSGDTSGPPAEEREWIRRAQQGDRHAFSLLGKAYYRRIQRVVTGFVHDREDALDVTQDVFVKAYRNLSGFQGQSSFYTWLYRIAMNACIDHRRRKAARGGTGLEYEDARRHDDPDDEAPVDMALRSSELDSPQKAALNREMGERLVQAIEDLSDKHRQVLLLREVDGLTYEEIAAQAKCNLGTVMSRLFHARKKVQAALADYRAGGAGGRDEG